MKASLALLTLAGLFCAASAGNAGVRPPSQTGRQMTVPARRAPWTVGPTLALAVVAAAAAGQPLAGTRPLEMQGDLAEQMVAGIDRYLTRMTETAARERSRFWKRDFSTPEAYSRSLEPNRERLRRILGVVDARVPFKDIELVSTRTQPSEIGTALQYRVLAVRWPVLHGVDAEGLLLEPHRPAVANVVALPDCDWTPEMLAGLAPGVPAEAQFARRLAESGCRVLIPTLINREDRFSGNPAIRMTNQPHREFVYRGAFEMGRHVIGYEVQKVLAAVDWFTTALPRSAVRDEKSPIRAGVIGYGEGGLLALYSAALDPRIEAAVVSGYFGPREALFREPIYRNVWGLLEQFGDAELAAMVAPRTLIVEASRGPEVAGPPPVRDGRSGAAPGQLTTPPLESVRAECNRARELTRALKPAPVLELTGEGGQPGGEETLTRFLRSLAPQGVLSASGEPSRDLRKGFDPHARQKRQFDQMVEFNERLMREGEVRRRELWAKAQGANAEQWRESSKGYRDHLWEEVIGRLPAPDAVPPHAAPGNPRTRLVYDEPKYRGYEVVLDVWPEVYAYGILLVPKDVKEGERRPVVVCQHGLEGRPQDVADPKVNSPYYHQFACRLAERGFVTFSPQNPYIGQDRFRVLQRKANPLKKSLFSVIVRQHERILEWLAAQPFVDTDRIGFYGLSYGGKTAMRVPALLEQYSLSICSGDFNEWIWKNVTTRWRGSYMFTGEYEMPEFDLGNTYNYAEMSWLICPRPFMVERGHDDGVAPSEWVGYEFTKTRERYDRLGIGDRTQIEYFNGPHTIHGVGTFDFLHRHLRWPKPAGE